MLSDMSPDAADHAKQCEDAHQLVFESATLFQAAKNHLEICQSKALSDHDPGLVAAYKRWSGAAADYHRAIAAYSALLLK